LLCVSTSALHLKKKRAKAPLVVTEVRSERLKGKSVGFKADSCASKTYFYCSTEPPTLSAKVIRSLGADFCKIPPKVLFDEALKSKPIRKKQVISKELLR
jgi:hypothetical protein